MAQYPFLSTEWIEEARKIQAEYAGRLGQTSGEPILVNLVIADVPGADGPLEAHFSSSQGRTEIDLGHLPGANATVTLDHAIAQAIFVEGDLNAGIQAFWTGKVQVAGDLATLISVFGGSSADPLAGEIGQRLRAITAPTS